MSCLKWTESNWRSNVLLSALNTQVMFITGFSGVTLRAGESVPKGKNSLQAISPAKDLVLEVQRLFEPDSLTELN